ncbi:hypothetical protein J5226_03455 [Lysobacter sp. K5869]|uniref:hypothetical protein n=1 Tax=Lysobacter sp. K5869 TaxID=2820808 RepID=UPI001C060614|nr:hypothetical protein [Lysobacter sp. K5869]QWP77474.1 hypothetical protein J5226_03455 [Lysobacter sp. K5869]
MRKSLYEEIADWCLTLLDMASKDEDSKILAMLRDNVVKNSGKKSIVEIATELSIAFEGEPKNRLKLIDETLLKKHGMTREYFLLKQNKKVRKILQQGAIRNDKEYEIVRSSLLDMEPPPLLKEALFELIAQYENAQGAAKI